MNENVIIDKKDLMIMKLLHYFVTEEDYNPIILHGVNDEIWLENLNNPYKVVRIVNHYIHNNEQLSFDNFKVKQITNKLKSKTLSRKMKVLNIYLDLGEAVNLTSDSESESVVVKKITDLKNEHLISVFPDILTKTKYEEKGMELFAKITNDINNANKEKTKKLDKIFSIKKPIITYCIIALCILTFILMYIFGNGSSDNLTLIKFGANLDILTVGLGEYFRLITCSFLHIGIFHLLFNMYALYVIGSQAESFFGKIKYLIIYLFSAVSASLLSLMFSANVISAGASGAIFGLMGALLYFGYHYRIYLGNVIKSQIIPIIVINLLFGFLVSGVDNAAHIGGLIGGFLTAMVLGVPEHNDKSSRINGMILLLIYLAFVIYMVFIGG